LDLAGLNMAKNFVIRNAIQSCLHSIKHNEVDQFKDAFASAGLFFSSIAMAFIYFGLPL
jgi:hypothetical protein